MKLSVAFSVFLAAVAQATELHTIANNLARDEDGLMHVGRDGVLRSFSRDLTVIDAAHVERDLETVSARDMLNPSEAVVQEVRDLRDYANAQIVKRGVIEKRCGGYCGNGRGCSPINEVACQRCINTRCGG